MDNKKELIKNFYTTVDRTRVKIETKNHGFTYLEDLKKLGELEYSEWKNNNFKYKLVDLKDGVFDELLDKHLTDEINYCAYFDSEKNNIFCFNLDSFDDDYTNLKITAIFLVENLLRLRTEPIILRSGHGYHIWCRLEKPVENSRLQDFMKNMMDVATFQTVCKGAPISDLQCIFYPRVHAEDISIRLFGTHHTVTGAFLSVVVKIDKEDTVLSEEESWEYFKEYLEKGTISETTFEFAEVAAKRFAETVK